MAKTPCFALLANLDWLLLLLSGGETCWSKEFLLIGVTFLVITTIWLEAGSKHSALQGFTSRLYPSWVAWKTLVFTEATFSFSCSSLSVWATCAHIALRRMYQLPNGAVLALGLHILLLLKLWSTRTIQSKNRAAALLESWDALR